MTAVLARRASEDEREQALSVSQARAILAGLSRSDSFATLVTLARMATGLDGRGTRAPTRYESLAIIESALERGALLIVPGSSPTGDSLSQLAGRNKEAAPDDRLADAVMGPRTVVPFEGNRYRVVSIRRWRQTQQQSRGGDFRLLPSRESRVVLKRILDSPQTPPAERAQWQNVLDRLLDGSTATAADGGVVLLRYAPPVQRAPDEVAAPPLTPAQIHPRIAPTDWIEIELVYEDGSPFEGDCTLVLPDGRTTIGPPDKDGLVRVEGIDPGSCKLTLSDLDEGAWAAP